MQAGRTVGQLFSDPGDGPTAASVRSLLAAKYMILKAENRNLCWQGCLSPILSSRKESAARRETGTMEANQMYTVLAFQGIAE